MPKIKVATVFSGGGIGIAALDKSKYEFVFAVEYDAKLAGLYNLNYGSDGMMVKRVQDVAQEEVLSKLSRGELDIFQASPVCKNFSSAKTNGIEGGEELSQARAVCNIIEWTYPKYVLVENVMAYRNSISFKSIKECLEETGYKVEWQVINSANYGVPQTRKRLLLVASRNDMPYYIWPQTTHKEGGEPDGLFGAGRKPWVGWYEAVLDLIDTFPASKFADWQLKRLGQFFGDTNIQVGDQRSHDGEQVTKREQCQPSLTVDTRPAGKWKAYIVSNGSKGFDQLQPGLVMRDSEEPAVTVTTGTGGRLRAFLVESKNAHQEYGTGHRDEEIPAYTVTAYDRPAHLPKALIIPGDNTGNNSIREEDEPLRTVRARSTGQCPARAFLVDGQGNGNGTPITVRDGSTPSDTVLSSSSRKPFRAWLEEGRVVQLTPRALARFQAVPDDYQLSGHNTTDCIAIGNGVCSLLVKIFFEAMSGVQAKSESGMAA